MTPPGLYGGAEAHRYAGAIGCGETDRANRQVDLGETENTAGEPGRVKHEPRPYRSSCIIAAGCGPLVGVSLMDGPEGASCFGVSDLRAPGTSACARRLMRQGSRQVEMSDEGLMSEDVEECLGVVLAALPKCDLPAADVIAWCSAMLDNDRVGFIAREPLQSMRKQFQAIAAR